MQATTPRVLAALVAPPLSERELAELGAKQRLAEIGPAYQEATRIFATFPKLKSETTTAPAQRRQSSPAAPPTTRRRRPRGTNPVEVLVEQLTPLLIRAPRNGLKLRELLEQTAASRHELREAIGRLRRRHGPKLQSFGRTHAVAYRLRP